MAYVPNAATVTEPVESRPVESAALEFRTLKEYVVELAEQVAIEDAKDLRVPESNVSPIPEIGGRAGKVLGFDASGQPIAVAISGADDPSLRADLAASYGASLVGHTPAGTGAVATTVQSKLRETVSVFDFMTAAQISDVRTGTASIDVTAAIQAALDYALGISLPTGQHGTVYVPSGKYRITDTIQVRSHINLIGDGYSSYSAGSAGTEIVWHGSTTGGTGLAAIITGSDKDSDWGNASIKKLRVSNSSGTSTNMAGIRVRNPQNGACIEDVFVSGFPGWQFFMYEPADRTATPGYVVGASPAAWTTKNLYAVGGVYPIEVQAGGEPSTHMMWHCAPGASSSAGVKITRSPFATAQRSTICFLGSYVELSDAAGDIPGWLWESDLPITFINCHTHHNGASVTEAAWKYTFAARNIPTASFVNCTSWKMAKLYNFATAGISKAPAVLATPESFSMDLNTLGSDINATFGNPAVNASLSSAVFHILGNSAFGNAGFVVPFRCVLVGFTARSSTSLTAGTATLVINKNGSTYVIDKTINSGESGFSVDYTIGTLITSAHVFESGDRVTMQITTAAGMLPTGYGLVANVFFKRLP